MSSSIEVTPFETQSMLEEKSILQWELNLKDKSYHQTAAFNPMKNVDAKFIFEVWFERKEKGCRSEKAELHVILRKLPDSLVHSNLLFEFLIFVYYSNGSLCKDYISDKPVELAEFTNIPCNWREIDVYYNSGNVTPEGTKLSSNKLTLKCEMKFTGHIMSPASHYANIDDLHDLRNLAKRFEAIYLSNELSDVDIQIGGKTLKSYKLLLAAHSSVFKTMLMQDFQEAKSGRITISDFEPDVFEKFLKFLYTGEVEDKSFSNFKELYSLADKYDVQTLKKECYKMLRNCNLTEEQTVDVFQMAYQYKDEKLKEKAMLTLLSTVQKE